MMVPSYAPIARRSAVVAGAAAVIMIALAAALSGSKGLTGAVIGAVVVAFFFGISLFTVSRAARVSPAAMMSAALGTFVVKILVLAIIFGQLQNTTAFNPRAFAVTVLVCVVVYSAAQVIWSIRLKMLYVGSDEKR
jgi:ATP synthase protein I